jgi:hypothetical protein
MRVFLDINRYVDVCRGETAVVEIVRRAESVQLPFAALAELRAGFRCGTVGRRNEVTLVRFLASPRVTVLYPDEQTTHTWAWPQTRYALGVITRCRNTDGTSTHPEVWTCHKCPMLCPAT